MFSESKVTEIYCIADDFFKEFALQQEKYIGRRQETEASIDSTSLCVCRN